MLFYINIDTDETYNEKAFTRRILKPEQKKIFKNRDIFDDYLMDWYDSVWLDKFSKMPMREKIKIRREWLEESYELARDNLLRKDGNIFAKIDTDCLDYEW